VPSVPGVERVRYTNVHLLRQDVSFESGICLKQVCVCEVIERNRKKDSVCHPTVREVIYPTIEYRNNRRVHPS
jgi:hypothetical protein